MLNAKDSKKMLTKIEWKEGKIVPIIEGPYRHQIVLHCSCLGRQTATFSNGTHNYFCYIRLVSGEGEWIKSGVAIVPILPDDRFIMIVEQRPAQQIRTNNIARIGGQDVNLAEFGEFSSLEFPGGAVEPGETLRSAAFREFLSETGAKTERKNQATCFIRRPLYQHGSDLALDQVITVALLSEVCVPDHVSDDGGLRVFVLSKEDIERNILGGVIVSGQAFFYPWLFYLQVEGALKDKELMTKMFDSGFFTEEKLEIIC